MVGFVPLGGDKPSGLTQLTGEASSRHGWYKDNGEELAGMSDESLETDRCLIDSSPPAESAFGIGMAALIMTIFGFIWLGWGFSVSSAFTNFSYGSLALALRWLSFYGAFVGVVWIIMLAMIMWVNLSSSI
jgi:hypothetical protein